MAKRAEGLGLAKVAERAEGLGLAKVAERAGGLGLVKVAERVAERGQGLREAHPRAVLEAATSA